MAGKEPHINGRIKFYQLLNKRTIIMFHQILPDALVQAGGWTILHSLWQGALITLLLAFILGRTRDRSPALRYHLSVGALFLLLGAVLITFFQYYEPAAAQL